MQMSGRISKELMVICGEKVTGKVNEGMVLLCKHRINGLKWPPCMPEGNVKI